MGTSLDALRLLMTSILSTQPWWRDPNVINVPWRQDIVDATLSRATPTGLSNNKMPLKLGIFRTDGIVTPHPPIARGVNLVANAVEAAGHQASWGTPWRVITSKADL